MDRPSGRVLCGDESVDERWRVVALCQYENRTSAMWRRQRKSSGSVIGIEESGVVGGNVFRYSLGLVSSSRPHRRPRITGLKVRSKPNYVSHSDSPRAITISACMTSLQRVMICSDLLFSEDALLEQKSSIKREKVKSQRNVIQGERRSTKMDKSSLGLLSWRGGLPCRQNSLSVRVIL